MSSSENCYGRNFEEKAEMRHPNLLKKLYINVLTHKIRLG